MTTLRRQVKNMVKNYSEAEVKVREATSNDPWGPSSTLMSEISDLTYNIVALGEVMRMIWKRLNDHGKNWRHVYKSLVLLDYLIKNGNEKVAQQCKEHIVAIQTLKDFQHMEEQKDQGASVREKAKQLVNLLRDDERLKAERAKAFKARERFAQNAMGISSDNKIVYANRHLSSSGSGRAPNASYADPYGGAGAAAAAALGAEGAAGTDPSLSPDLEAVRPSDANEEDLQIKLAIMLSQQEHEEEVQRKRADEAKLQIALEQSKFEGQPNGLVDISDDPWGDVNTNGTRNGNGLFSQLNNHNNTNNKTPDAFLNDPWASQPNSASSTEHHDPWKIAPPPNLASNTTSITTNPWQANASSKPQAANTAADPWLTNTPPSNNNNKLDDFELFSSNRTSTTSKPATNDDPFGDFFGAAPAAASKPSTNPWNDSTSNSVKHTVSDLDPFANPTEPFQSQPAAAASKPAVINPIRKTPESFLGENSSLVNLDNLISARPKSTNPFGSAITQPSQMTSSSSFGQLNNPFASQQAASQKQPTINQLQQQSMFTTQLGQPSITPTPNMIIGQLAQPLIVPPATSTTTSALFPATTAPAPSLFPQLTNPYGALPNFPPLNNPPTTNGAATAAASTNPFLMM